MLLLFLLLIVINYYYINGPDNMPSGYVERFGLTAGC